MNRLIYGTWVAKDKSGKEYARYVFNFDHTYEYTCRMPFGNVVSRTGIFKYRNKMLYLRWLSGIWKNMGYVGVSKTELLIGFKRKNSKDTEVSAQAALSSPKKAPRVEATVSSQYSLACEVIDDYYKYILSFDVVPHMNFRIGNLVLDKPALWQDVFSFELGHLCKHLALYQEPPKEEFPQTDSTPVEGTWVLDYLKNQPPPFYDLWGGSYDFEEHYTMSLDGSNLTGTLEEDRGGNVSNRDSYKATYTKNGDTITVSNSDSQMPFFSNGQKTVCIVDDVLLFKNDTTCSSYFERESVPVRSGVSIYEYIHSIPQRVQQLLNGDIISTIQVAANAAYQVRNGETAALPTALAYFQDSKDILAPLISDSKQNLAKIDILNWNIINHDNVFLNNFEKFINSYWATLDKIGTEILTANKQEFVNTLTPIYQEAINFLNKGIPPIISPNLFRVLEEILECFYGHIPQNLYITLYNILVALGQGIPFTLYDVFEAILNLLKDSLGSLYDILQRDLDKLRPQLYDITLQMGDPLIKALYDLLKDQGKDFGTDLRTAIQILLDALQTSPEIQGTIIAAVLTFAQSICNWLNPYAVQIEQLPKEMADLIQPAIPVYEDAAGYSKQVVLMGTPCLKDAWTQAVSKLSELSADIDGLAQAVKNNNFDAYDTVADKTNADWDDACRFFSSIDLSQANNSPSAPPVPALQLRINEKPSRLSTRSS